MACIDIPNTPPVKIVTDDGDPIMKPDLVMHLNTPVRVIWSDGTGFAITAKLRSVKVSSSTTGALAYTIVIDRVGGVML